MFNKIETWVSATLKAHVAGLTAAIALLITFLQAGQTLDLAHWAGIVGAYLGVGVATYTVPNTPPYSPTSALAPDNETPAVDATVVV